jgi:hypothetical protein
MEKSQEKPICRAIQGFFFQDFSMVQLWGLSGANSERAGWDSNPMASGDVSRKPHFSADFLVYSPPQKRTIKTASLNKIRFDPKSYDRRVAKLSHSALGVTELCFASHNSHNTLSALRGE